jgi:membrane protease YdiL (CAAX protease family)
MKKERKKQKNIWLYFMKMIVLFVIIFLVSQFGAEIIESNFKYLKYGPELISQSIWALTIVIVVIVFKNSYIFTEKREKIVTGLKLGWPLLAIASIYMVINIIYGIIESANFNIPTILNLAIFCLLIGIAEEFLCRGWLLNEFLERFSNSKKNIVLSIILSSVIFGLMHIVNISAGQTLVETIIQIINATFLGVFFALIYYKTKNIWSVVIIHAFWDFGVMLGDSTRLVDCVPGTMTNSILIYHCIVAVIIVIAASGICYWIYKQTQLNEKKSKISKSMYIIIPIVSSILYIGSDFITPKEYENFYHCPVYETKKIDGELEVQYYMHSKYVIEHSKIINNINTPNSAYIPNAKEKYSFTLSLNEETFEIELQNDTTKEKIVLTESMVYNYLIIDNKESYVILIQNDINKVLYGIYNKDEITNDKNYLENVKNQLKEYYVPNISQIGSVTFGSSDYKYAQIQTTIYDKLYFDEKGTLYLVTIE